MRAMVGGGGKTLTAKTIAYASHRIDNTIICTLVFYHNKSLVSECKFTKISQYTRNFKEILSSENHVKIT